MTAYYNEFDKQVARWLRNLIEAGHITPGVFDDRSIEDVSASDLAGFTQCHFFAGVGVWSRALRLAHWPDDRPVWTGSCPCQPFSSAGAGFGFADKRHLWPAFRRLIAKRKPPVVFGEQVASRDADAWIDLVQDDLEAMGYAVGAVPFPAASIGAPHIRDRLYWVADADGERFEGRPQLHGGALEPGQQAPLGHDAGGCGGHGGVGHPVSPGLAQRLGVAGVPGGTPGADPRQAPVGAGLHVGGLADTTGERWVEGRLHVAEGHRADGTRQEPLLRTGRAPGAAGPTNGHWRAADWLLCRDGRWRPVEPGTRPLADGAPSRVVRLRAFGNAIVAQQAEAFIRAYRGY